MKNEPIKKFIKDILVEHFGDRADEIFSHSDLLKYLNLKTSAIYGNTKARKSLANIYAIYSILHFYVKDFFNQKAKYLKFSGYEFTKLLSFCRSLYGGEKIQNHALNSRLNLEFDNKAASPENKGKYIVVINDSKYSLHVDYIYVDGIDISKVVLEIIDIYIVLLKKKDNELITRLKNLESENDLNKVKLSIKSLLTEDSEARVFEIVSYAILKNYYKNTKVYFGYSLDDLKEENLKLYKTGRTNANDGGIDFVMRPVGRFFQVTEVGNYDKYLLDIDKVLHFPITFVIKTEKSQIEIQKEVNSYIKERSGGMEVLEKRYKEAFEEIITINEIKDYFESLNDEQVKGILNDINTFYQIEMNFHESKGLDFED